MLLISVALFLSVKFYSSYFLYKTCHITANYKQQLDPSPTLSHVSQEPWGPAQAKKTLRVTEPEILEGFH